MEKFAAWKWGEAAVVEAKWEPIGHGPGRGKKTSRPLDLYRTEVATASGLEVDDLPSEETLRTRAVAFYYASDYADEIAISAAYEAAVAMTSGRWDGTVPELLEAARDGKGKITVDGVRAVLDRPRATITRPRDMVQHAQRAGEHLRQSARDFLARDEMPDVAETENLVVALRQVVQVATLLLERIEGRDTAERELQGMISDATA
jgi:hypothetical protein